MAAFATFAAFTGQDTYGSRRVANGRVHVTCTEPGIGAQRALVDRQARSA